MLNISTFYFKNDDLKMSFSFTNNSTFIDFYKSNKGLSSLKINKFFIDTFLYNAETLLYNKQKISAFLKNFFNYSLYLDNNIYTLNINNINLSFNQKEFMDFYKFMSYLKGVI